MVIDHFGIIIELIYFTPGKGEIQQKWGIFAGVGVLSVFFWEGAVEFSSRVANWGKDLSLLVTWSVLVLLDCVLLF